LKRGIALILALLAALAFAGCQPEEERIPGYNYKNSVEITFSSEKELAGFLKDDRAIAEFEKDQIPVYGYYYRLKKLPYKVSSLEILYRQDSVSLSYYTEDPEFTQKNGGAYFAMLTWYRDKEQAQSDLQDMIVAGIPAAEGQKVVGGRTVFYGESEYPADEEGGQGTFVSAYYFMQDGFAFSIQFNFAHAESNFTYCEPEKVKVR